MPLSNPTPRAEAIPADVVTWTEGRALIGTGSPFDPGRRGEQVHQIAQVNNVYIFPGVGLGALAVGATRITDAMITAASGAVAELAVMGTEERLLPPIGRAAEAARSVATAVARQAVADGVSAIGDDLTDEAVELLVDDHTWRPVY